MPPLSFHTYQTDRLIFYFFEYFVNIQTNKVLWTLSLIAVRLILSLFLFFVLRVDVLVTFGKFKNVALPPSFCLGKLQNGQNQWEDGDNMISVRLSDTDWDSVDKLSFFASSFFDEVFVSTISSSLI